MKYYDLNHISYMNRENIIRILENCDCVRVFSKTQGVYIIYLSKDSYKNVINIWFEIYGKDVNSQFYDFVLCENELSDDLFERRIPNKLKEYLNRRADDLQNEIELL